MLIKCKKMGHRQSTVTLSKDKFLIDWQNVSRVNINNKCIVLDLNDIDYSDYTTLKMTVCFDEINEMKRVYNELCSKKSNIESKDGWVSRFNAECPSGRP